MSSPTRFINSRTWAILALVAVTQGCASFALEMRERRVARRFESAVKELSPECVSLHDAVPYVSPTYEDSCGVSCLDMILAYEGRSLGAERAQSLRAKVEREGSITLGDLKCTLEEAGFLAIHLQGNWNWSDEVGPEAYASWKNPPYHVDRGRPVILRIAIGEDRYHFLLLVGYDPVTRDLVIVNPGRGKEVWPESALRAWEAAGSWFVAYQPPAGTNRDGEVSAR